MTFKCEKMKKDVGDFSSLYDIRTFQKTSEIERRTREYAVLLLRLAKGKHTYRELSQAVDMQITVLSRYVKGWVLPSLERSRIMIERLQTMFSLPKWLADNINLDEWGYFDNTPIISNPAVLELASYDCISRFVGRRVTAVLTAAVDGVPLATAIAVKLNAKLVIAKTYEEVGVSSFIKYDEVMDGSRRTWYIPKILEKRDDVLIVDDVVREGRTLKNLLELVRKVGSSIAGIYALITVGESYKAIIPNGVKYETGIQINISKE